MDDGDSDHRDHGSGDARRTSKVVLSKSILKGGGPCTRCSIDSDENTLVDRRGVRAESTPKSARRSFVIDFAHDPALRSFRVLGRSPVTKGNLRYSVSGTLRNPSRFARAEDAAGEGDHNAAKGGLRCQYKDPPGP